MNRNRKIKIATCALAASLLMVGSVLPAQAAPFAGATANLAQVEQCEANVTTETNVFSGTNQALYDLLSNKTGVVESAHAEVVAIQQQEEEAAQAALVEAGLNFDTLGIAQVESYVNIREGASEDSESVGKLYANGAANIIGMEGDWYHVSSGNVEGFIKADYLTVGDQALAESVSENIANVNTETLFVRADMTTESEVLEMAPDGAKLKVIDDSTADAGWVKVNTGEGEGFVSVDYVDISREYEEAESKAEEEARLAREAAEAEAARRASASSSQSSGGGGGAAAPAGGGTGAAVASYGLQFVGNPYVYGGASLTGGADCSGFVMAVYSAFGVGLPHSSSADRGVGYGVDPSQMQAGDIVCYEGHVGIAIGNGQIVHASTPSSGITVGSAYYKPIVAVRRIF